MPPHDRAKPKDPISNLKNFQTQDMLAAFLSELKKTDKVIKELKLDFSKTNQIVISHFASISNWRLNLGISWLV